MIPYWIVNVEWREKGDKRSRHSVYAASTYEAAEKEAVGWKAICADTAEHRVEIAGPFYRRGF